MTLTWEKIFTRASSALASNSAGCYHLPDGSLLAAIAENDAGDAKQHFYRSTNNGASWTHQSDKPCATNQRGQRLLHFPSGAIIFPTLTNGNDTVSIFRSTDNAATWAEVASYDRTPGPGHVFPDILTARQFNRTSGIIGGLIADTIDITGVNFLITNDEGASWTKGPRIFTGTSNSLAYSISAKPGPHLLAGGNAKSVQISTDSGATWTPISSSPLPGPGSNILPWDSCFLTDNNVVLCAQGFVSASAGATFLYTSNDGGDKFTPVAQGDILGWPTSGANPVCVMLARLTRDAALLGIQSAAIASAGPVRLTIDSGATWPTAGTGFDYTDDDQTFCGGHVAISNTGSIFIVVDYYNDDSAVAEGHLWRGTLTC